MNTLRQIWIVSALNFRSLRSRLWQSLVIVVGMACVIGVLLSMLSMTEGLHNAYLNTGDPRNVFVISSGALSEGAGSISRDKARIIMDVPGIAKAPDGSAIADPGLALNVPARLLNGARASINLRGMGAKGVMLRPEFHLVRGRMFRPGTHELIVGIHARDRFRGTAVGDKVILPDGEWPIVGAYATGDLRDGEMFGDTETVMLSARRKAYNSVLLRLDSPGGFAAFAHALKANPALNVDVMPLHDWNAKRSASFTQFFRTIVYGVGILLAIGALFGCFNTMYSAVASRRSEIATLRALGYGGLPVAVSVILEAGALSAAGAAVGAAFAWARYDGVIDGFGSDIFRMIVSPAMIGMAMLWAIAVAFLGGVLPSIQAARRPVSDALRAT
ncbi:MAG TPA: FtsX-like permease family protein [Rhizomicrobium sp.]|jgi:putative ABC transport system permease protein|nr:FtsX-like permease family protein [Rhizomicrobium sp.]